MKITLRKRNSVTSIVLFIYNIYYQTMEKSEIELSNLLDYIKKFGKSDSAARVSLSRMVKANILINKSKDSKVYYQLTEEGSNNIEAWNKAIDRFFKRYRLRHREWDNKWTIFTLIDFKKSREENQFILENLRELGYREVDNNVWVSPYYFTDEIKALMAEKDIKYLFSRGIIRTNIELNKIYEVDDLRKKYRQFIKDIEKMKQNIKKENLKDEDLLPLLFKLGWNFYDIVTDAPALPLDLLDGWIEDKAVSEMKEFRESLANRIGTYFEKNNGT